jgi:hypothetical protein
MLIDDETHDIMRLPTRVAVFDPDFGDFPGNRVNVLAEGIWTPKPGIAIRFIHRFYAYATIAMP